MNDASNRLAVIGGGIVGICAALFAQRAGHSVTLVEPYEPGSQTSFGNAGIICGGHYVPAAMPRAPMELLKLALNRTTYASYRVGALPGFARWLAAFWKQGAPERLNRTAEATLAAMGETVGLHRKLLGEAGASELLRDNGWIAVFREDADLEGIRAELDFAREAGVSFQQMGPGEACELEPGLKPVFRHAVLWNENASVSDPFAVSQAYLGLFRAAGGSVVNARCMALAPRNGGWRLETDTGALEFPQVVVAAGIWSTDLLKPLGYGFPLKPKRGYHRHFSARGNAVLSRPVVDDGIGYVLAPMRGGIRMTSGIELAGAMRR